MIFSVLFYLRIMFRKSKEWKFCLSRSENSLFLLEWIDYLYDAIQ